MEKRDVPSPARPAATPRDGDGTRRAPVPEYSRVRGSTQCRSPLSRSAPRNKYSQGDTLARLNPRGTSPPPRVALSKTTISFSPRGKFVLGILVYILLPENIYIKYSKKNSIIK